MSDAQGLIYRQARYGNRAKSVALRRESDYHTGLSFSQKLPLDQPYFVYRIVDLEEAGYKVEPDAGEVIVSKWDSHWTLRDASGAVRRYGVGHVSIYQDHPEWRAWYEAELMVGGDGSSPTSRRFYAMALEYREG